MRASSPEGSRQRRSRFSGVAVRVLAAGAVLAIVAVVLAWPRWDEVANLPARAVTRWVKPPQGEVRALRGRERRALRELAERLDARIVWSSNRSGNHELYVLDVGESEARRITDNPHVDYASRFSPDGAWIVFARSQREWVSFREIDAWDLYLIRSDGTDERLLTRHGYYPGWAQDGRAVVFQRGNRVVEIDVETGVEEVLFDSDVTLEGRTWGDQALHPGRHLLAMALKGVGAIVITTVDNEFSHLTDGSVCETVWVPGTEELLWVAPEGNGGTRIMRGAADGSHAEVFMDLPGERSHEYFPSLSADGEWMVWGAAAEGHEHDRADYEIYVWEVGTPWETATRLTYYSGNDQRPDIHRLQAPSREGG